MNNQIDNKKIIQMVAIIGILCLFVGIATRIRQNSQVTLADVPKASTAETTSNDESSEKKQSEASKPEEKDVADTNHTYGDQAQYEYENFYYILRDGTAKLHILYYNSSHEVSKAELSCPENIADEKLKLFYDLYKGGHDFSDISELTKYCE